MLWPAEEEGCPRQAGAPPPAKNAHKTWPLARPPLFPFHLTLLTTLTALSTLLLRENTTPNPITRTKMSSSRTFLLVLLVAVLALFGALFCQAQ